VPEVRFKVRAIAFITRFQLAFHTENTTRKTPMDMADVEGLRRHADLYRRGGGLVPPAEVVLSWPAPNYVNPETHNESALNVVIVFFALSIAVFVARIWARVKLAKNAGLDDLIMTFAMIPLLAMTVATVLGEYPFPRSVGTSLSC